MSWVRLLAAGKSLIGIKDGVSPYRLARKNRLPKFPPASNPFRATTLPSGAALREVEESMATPKEAGQASNQGRFHRMARLFNPRLRFSAPAEHRPVQTELALERVKVVRNDLLDADLEVVPGKPRLQLTPKPGVGAPGHVPVGAPAHLSDRK